MNYTHEFSNYPNKLIELDRFEDVDDSLAVIINQINALRASGQYNSAAVLINKNAELLKKVAIGADVINKLIEEIRNVQIKGLSANQCIVTSEDEPGDLNDGDVWIGGVR